MKKEVGKRKGKKVRMKKYSERKTSKKTRKAGNIKRKKCFKYSRKKQ